MDTLHELREAQRTFAAERDWDQFHTPKNLAMALAAEAGELLEPFQWLTPEQSANPDATTRAAVREEIADVLLYLVRLADTLDIDLAVAAREKLARNAQKYPVGRARGKADKYDAY
jgi:dCTP diphosphatase